MMMMTKKSEKIGERTRERERTREIGGKEEKHTHTQPVNKYELILYIYINNKTRCVFEYQH